MQLLDRIEKRRFVGREFLLWLWFESEMFEGTLSTADHVAFGLWIETSFTLSLGKETTRIKGAYPAGSRESKEALLRGKLPEACGLHLSWRDQETSFTLKAEQMAFAGLRLPTVLGAAADEAPKLLDEARPPPRGKKRAKKSDDASDEAHEAFYERMHLTRDVEGLVEALYRDFLVLRLGAAWEGVVVPALHAWARGEAKPDADSYREASRAALGSRRAPRGSRQSARKNATSALRSSDDRSSP
jgi:hypothetical protein